MGFSVLDSWMLFCRELRCSLASVALQPSSTQNQHFGTIVIVGFQVSPQHRAEKHPE